MSKKVFKQGINLEPIDLPISAIEGDVFNSDGTILPKGLHQRINGNWELLSASSPELSSILSTGELIGKVAVTDGIGGVTLEDKAPTISDINTEAQLAGLVIVTDGAGNATYEKKFEILSQTKLLAADQSVDPLIPNSDIVFDLQFTNLVIGKVYQLYYNLNMTSDTDGFKGVEMTNGTDIVARLIQEVNPAGSGTASSLTVAGSSIPFVATSTDINVQLVSFNGDDTLTGNGTKTGSFTTLVELPATITTTTQF